MKLETEELEEKSLELYERLDTAVDDLEAVSDDNDREEIYDIISDAVKVIRTVMNEIY